MTATLPCLYPAILSVPAADRALKGRAKVQNLSRLARLALTRSCAVSGLGLDRFPKDEKGVPQPVDGIYWSLSHKSDIVGGVVSPLPVGMDLETIRPVRDALMAKVAADDEWRLTRGGDRQKLFFRFWTAKEAVLKAVGRGFAGLSRCKVKEITDETHMLLTYDNTPWPVDHFWFDGHVAAVTPHHFAVSWTRIS